MMPVSLNVGESIDQQVTRLLARWRNEVAHISSSTVIKSHPAYLELIDLGTAALPSMFRDMEQTKDGHLSSALSVITGASPIAEEDRGKIEKIAETWLLWARENGYRW